VGALPDCRVDDARSGVPWLACQPRGKRTRPVYAVDDHHPLHSHNNVAPVHSLLLRRRPLLRLSRQPRAEQVPRGNQSGVAAPRRQLQQVGRRAASTHRARRGSREPRAAQELALLRRGRRRGRRRRGQGGASGGVQRAACSARGSAQHPCALPQAGPHARTDPRYGRDPAQVWRNARRARLHQWPPHLAHPAGVRAGVEHRRAHLLCV
ncbi:hypothetical protein EMIHUDRAFT_447107, partial [Emiliania huxleyi CCMP1516]|uniref:Uncharacterized protein n=2 Tax=Emiliania huxleyi TaxID=2903 RepID=A0A0D3KAZ3_EMIH1